MKLVYIQLIVIFLLLIGEGLAIYSEISAAKQKENRTSSTGKIFIKMLLIAILAGAFLILGYMLGFQAFRNIWIVGIISITSILILEPIIAYMIFKQIPTKGSIIGFIFGTIGFLATIFID